MRINHKILSIPPYISTLWKNIASLQTHPLEEKFSLTIHLHDGSSVFIPELEKVIIEAIFEAHSKYVENNLHPTPDLPLKIPGLESFASLLHHNFAESNAPDLPKTFLSKISEITSSMGIALFQNKAEPHCNCPHCQLARATQGVESLSSTEETIEVSDSDLSFRSWIIEPIESSLYKVFHPDDPEIEFQVFLGTPIGCTCGSDKCEHIQAVLRS